MVSFLESKFHLKEKEEDRFEAFKYSAFAILCVPPDGG